MISLKRQRKRSTTRRSRVLAAFVIIAGLGIPGCGQDSESVYIDLSKIVLEPEAAVLFTDGGTVGIAEASLIIEGLPEELIERDDAVVSADDLLYEAEQRQFTTFVQIRDRLVRAYQADLDATEYERVQEMLEAFQTEADEKLEEVWQLMQTNAIVVGPLRHRLAWLVGFPDPDPESRRTARAGDIDAQARYAEAAELRTKIAEATAAFKAESERLMAEARDNLRFDLEDWAIERAEIEDEMLANAERKAQEDVERAFAEIENSALDPARVLPAAEGAEVTIPASSGLPIARRQVSGKDGQPAESRLKEQAKIFTDSHGWVLTSYPDKGRDVTEEFLNWRRRMLDED
jgi:hypothetical protein